MNKGEQLLEINKIYQGDCLELMQSIDDKSIDMILCDLPYGTTACKWDVVIPFEPLWEHYKRIIKDRGAIVLFGSEPFSSYLRMSNIKNYKCEWYWKKERGTNFVQAKRYKLGSKISANTVKHLRSSIPSQGQGAFITTADFQASAAEIALEPGFPRIGLINGRQLVDLLIEHWNDIPSEFQERLGLQPGLVKG